MDGPTSFSVVCTATAATTDDADGVENVAPQSPPPAVTNLTDAAAALRELCVAPVADPDALLGLTEAELFESCAATLEAGTVPVDYPKVLVICSNQLQRTVLRLSLVHAGFSVVEAHSIRDASAQRCYHNMDLVITDLTSELDVQDTLSVLRAKCKVVPCIALLPSVEEVENVVACVSLNIPSEEEKDCSARLAPHHLISIGFSLTHRKPLHSFIARRLPRIFVTSERRAVTMTTSISSNYSRIKTVLAEVCDRSLFYQVKDASKAYQGVVKGSVEVHPSFISMQNENRTLKAKIADIREQERDVQTSVSELGVRVHALEAELRSERVKNGELEGRLKMSDALCKQSLVAIEDRYIHDERLQETSLGQRLSHDREVRIVTERCESLQKQLTTATHEVRTLKAHLCTAEDSLKDAASEIEFLQCKAEAIAVETLVPKGVTADTGGYFKVQRKGGRYTSFFLTTILNHFFRIPCNTANKQNLCFIVF